MVVCSVRQLPTGTERRDQPTQCGEATEGKDPLEKEMVTQSSILAWRIPWTEESGCSPWDHKDLDTSELLTL